MDKNLIIVESPAKAKTIQNFLGNNFIVKSSFGHIRDLPSKGLNIDIKDNFKPIYKVPADKTKIVNELKKIAKNKNVWLASDEDREGEAIAWHLSQILKIDPQKTKRIVFHEITKKAIDQAIKNPRTINMNMVNAQQARRILDRLVGYELSPVLWKKIKAGLSAGRVQSVAVRLIVEREREIRQAKRTTFFKIIGDFSNQAKTINFTSELNQRFDDLTQTEKWLKSLTPDNKFIVKSIEHKKSTRQPYAPFTTSTLQQEASRKLNFSVKSTMILAQKLYEAGYITYMRTDSTILSEEAQNLAEEYIIKNFGQQYYRHKQYITKNSNAQEAHEAIRPTNFNTNVINDDISMNKLYQLIKARAIASQMSPAIVLKSEINIAINQKKEYFFSKGEIIEFDGFLKVYQDKIEDKLLPNLKPNDLLICHKLEANETFNRLPARYIEATLVKKLEELGIGRPSTYAPTISTIQTRGYIEKKDIIGQEVKLQSISLDLTNFSINRSINQVIVGNDKNKLVPTSIAEVTTDFLVKYFPDIVDYQFTAKIEENFDKIIENKIEWHQMINDFYQNFHPLVEKSDQISRKEANQSKLLGVDPKTKKNVYARFSKYGPVLQIGESDNKEEKVIFASMPKNKTIETISLEEALEMFKLPRSLGLDQNNNEIIVNIGRFGPYIKYQNKFYAIKDGADPFNITKTQAIKLINQKKEADQKKNLKEFDNGIKILDGRYGPYITDGKINVKIPKNLEISEIDQPKALELINHKPSKFKHKK